MSSAHPTNLRVYDPTAQQTPIASGVEDIVPQPSSPFPTHCLPPVAQRMATAIAGAVGVPESLSGPAILGVLSASIGTGLEVRSGPVRTSRANLYIVVSAESGTGKSESMRLALAPLLQYDAEIKDRHEQHVLPNAEAEIEILSVEIGKLKKLAGKELTEEGRRQLQDDLSERKVALAAAETSKEAPVLTVEDVTVERLAALLSLRGETLTSLSPDAGGAINNLLGRYNSTERTDESLYLKAWTGEYCRVDRQGRRAIWLKRPWLSLLWFVQPDKVTSLLAVESLRDGGFIQRLLLCHSGCRLQKLNEHGRTVGTAAFSHDTAVAWGNLVRELMASYRTGGEEASIVVPDSDASLLFIEHYNTIVDRWDTGELKDVTSFVVRWTEQAWRIALCLHAGVHGSNAASVHLTSDTAQSALDLADWFAEQQLAILSDTRVQQRKSRLGRLRTLIAEYGGEASLRDLSKSNGFDPAEVRRLAAEFPAMLMVMKRETKGRPSEVALIPGPQRSPSKVDSVTPPNPKSPKSPKRGAA